MPTSPKAVEVGAVAVIVLPLGVAETCGGLDSPVLNLTVKVGAGSAVEKGDRYPAVENKSQRTNCRH
jgi:hypothetical protein